MPLKIYKDGEDVQIECEEQAIKLVGEPTDDAHIIEYPNVIVLLVPIVTMLENAIATTTELYCQFGNKDEAQLFLGDIQKTLNKITNSEVVQDKLNNTASHTPETIMTHIWQNIDDMTKNILMNDKK